MSCNLGESNHLSSPRRFKEFWEVEVAVEAEREREKRREQMGIVLMSVPRSLVCAYFLRVGMLLRREDSYYVVVFHCHHLKNVHNFPLFRSCTHTHTRAHTALNPLITCLLKNLTRITYL